MTRFADITIHALMQLQRCIPFFMLCVLYLTVSNSAHAGIFPIQVVINDPAPYHIHKAGQNFKISVTINSQPDVEVLYTWKDFKGNALSTPMQLIAGQSNDILSPSAQIGYYSLVLMSKSDAVSLPNREPGEDRNYGFAILPQALISDRLPNMKSTFGVVHADIADPYLPSWSKTMTWKSTSAKWWKHEIEKRRAKGIEELPIISRSVWDSDDSKPISATQLDQLKARVKSYFKASPSTLYWETGIEENIKARYREDFYWNNLEKKLKVVRAVSDEVNSHIKLIYQIAGLKQKAVINFAKSRASKLIDILSIHPYAWPNFPSPETWHDNYLVQARQNLKAYGLNLPIWYTEVGATHHGNAPGRFFGYPKKHKQVIGLSPYQATIYLIKLHVMALHAGVEKIFWYNYQDRKPEREFAENHFGLRDYWGYPKPVYVAYVHLHRLLADKTAGKKIDLGENIHAYEFFNTKIKVLVLWFFSATSTEITLPLASLTKLAPQYQSFETIDPMGKTIPFSGNSITLSSTPLFLVFKQN